MEIEKLQNFLRQVAGQRQWDQFHTPKNLSMALSVEASELVEIFQWLTPDESIAIVNTTQYESVKDEVADIAIYLLRICDKLDINLEECIYQKMEKNIKKYPVDKAKGNAKKYNQYE